MERRPQNGSPWRLVGFAVLATAMIGLAYLVSYVAMSDVRTLPLPQGSTVTRVFKSRLAYRIFKPLRWIEESTTGCNTAYQEPPMAKSPNP